MKIIIENLGPIKKFDFDINKDFHIIYGKNNIGKSYAISAIYILLKYLVIEPIRLESFLIFKFLIGENKEKSQDVEKLILNIENKIREQKNREFSINKISENILISTIKESYLPEITKSFKNSFSNFENLKNKLNTNDFSIKILLSEFQFTIKLSKNNELFISSLQFVRKTSIRIISTNRKTVEKEDKNVIYVNKSGFNKEKLQSEIIQVIYSQAQLSINNLRQQIDEIYFLPASRSGLYQAMNIFSSVFAKLSQIRHLVNSQIDIPALSEPVSDYFLKLSTIKLTKSKDKYSAIASAIENEILKGKVIFNNETKKIEYIDKKSKLTLDLSETSSMVSEISPIVAYLKYVINEKNEKNETFDFLNIFSRQQKQNIKSKKLIFIEEPEAHLHPKIQVRLIDFFAKLINLNIKIILTTHSDFISNKITNLILAKELKHYIISSYHLVMKKGGSVDSGDMKATEEGIEDYNFLDLAEELYEERINLSNTENE